MDAKAASTPKRDELWQAENGALVTVSLHLGRFVWFWEGTVYKKRTLSEFLRRFKRTDLKKARP